MEPYIADLINNSKIPKSIRFLIILILCSFIIFLGIILGLKSPFILGNVFGFLLALAFLVILIYLGIKILNNK